MAHPRLFHFNVSKNLRYTSRINPAHPPTSQKREVAHPATRFLRWPLPLCYTFCEGYPERETNLSKSHLVSILESPPGRAEKLVNANAHIFYSPGDRGSLCQKPRRATPDFCFK